MSDTNNEELKAEAWGEARRGALSSFLFTIFDMGTQPNALREADLILEMLDALSFRPPVPAEPHACIESDEEGSCPHLAAVTPQVTSDEYTPTTEWVQAGWMKARMPDGVSAEESFAEFDRWLTAHDAEILASRPSVEGEGPTPGGIPDLTEAEASAYWEALHPSVEGEGEALAWHFADRRVGGEALIPNEDDWAAADALLARFSITRKETKQTNG